MNIIIRIYDKITDLQILLAVKTKEFNQITKTKGAGRAKKKISVT
jgi:hypothetical protein